MGADRKLLAAERRQRVLERVVTEGALEYPRLADELGVSVMTIRRDIKELVDKGFLTVTRGGATAYFQRERKLVENPRIHEQTDEKLQIGATAARRIEPGETILLGGGSTTGSFAQFLDPADGHHVVTAALRHASTLAARGFMVTSLAGSVIQEELAATGPLALETIERFQATTAVLGAAGISTGAGLTERRMELGEISRAMLRCAGRSMVLLDATKIGVTAPYRVSRAADVGLIVTSQLGFERMSLEVGDEAPIVADPPSTGPRRT